MYQRGTIAKATSAINSAAVFEYNEYLFLNDHQGIPVGVVG